MPLELTSLRALLALGFDDIIDVRSPAEFAEDHIAGAINLPVLDNEERARVGTLYKQVSPFKARKLGASLVFKNAAAHVQGPLMDRAGAWRPLVYCWRGGQRSGTFAWMLGEIGWRSETVLGGYRAYRRLVVDCLYESPLPFRLVQLGGYTGTAKTALLPLLEQRGVQVLDLEGMAQHRGSLLGAMPGGQPSQKAFESRLAMALARLDPARPIVVEAESSKIGELNLPPSLWEAMKRAPWIEVTAPLDARARYLAQAYQDVLADSEALRDKLSPLRFHRGQAVLDHFDALIAAGDTVALCRALAQDHYDLAYDKSMSVMAPRVLAHCETRSLDPDALGPLADRIVSALQSSVI